MKRSDKYFLSGKQMRESKWIDSVLNSRIKRGIIKGKIIHFTCGCGCGVDTYVVPLDQDECKEPKASAPVPKRKRTVTYEK